MFLNKKVTVYFLASLFVFMEVFNVEAATVSEKNGFKADNQEKLSEMLNILDELDAALGILEQTAEGERLKRGGADTEIGNRIKAIRSSLGSLRNSVSQAQQTSNQLTGGATESSYSGVLGGESTSLQSAKSAASKAVTEAVALGRRVGVVDKELGGGDSFMKTYRDQAAKIEEILTQTRGFYVPLFSDVAPSLISLLDQKIAAISKFQADKLSKKTAATGGKEKNYAVTIRNNQSTVASGKFQIAGIDASRAKISSSRGVTVTESGIDGIYFSIYNLPRGGTARVVVSGVPVDGGPRGSYLGEADAPSASLAAPREGTQVFEGQQIPTQVKTVDGVIQSSPPAPTQRILTPGLR